MTEIRLWNTRTKRKEVLDPVVPGHPKMYVCGPTVYDRAHLGNARPAVVFDVLYRLLRHTYGENNVTYVRNFTDVDDKINAKAAETGRPIRDITDETIRWYRADMDALGNLRPTHEPRATDWIPAMVAMIGRLIAQGHAYEAAGHVLFRVRSYARYGALSGRSVDDMIAGSRVEVAPFKEDPLDFVLWKPSDATQPGWPSPWGHGRPGWHIECSAMARELLGGAFDIHGGGIDLQFPHHENEIAQSRCAHPEEAFASIWMHNEMLVVEGKKMSKSLGNFFTVRDLLDKGVPGEVIRFVLLGTHYSKPMDWTEERVREATVALHRWYRLVGLTVPASDVDAAVLHSLADDLNVPAVINRLHQLANSGDVPALRTAMTLLGLLDTAVPHWARVDGFTEAEAGLIQLLLQRRDFARQQRDFARADRIRDMMTRAGVQVRDRGIGEAPELVRLPHFDPRQLEEVR